MENTIEVKKVNGSCFDKTTEDILQKLEKTRTDFWNLDRQSANFLNTLIKINNSKRVLEIGTSNGYSGIWILKALKETSGKLTTIEFWEKRQSVARKNFKTCCPDVEVEPKIGSAIVILEDLLEEIKQGKREKFDFVFIDANKKEYISYFKLIDEMLEDNAVILSDNILSHYEKVEDYVNLLFDRKDYQSQILDLGTGMMLSRKSKN
ncbi:MAG: class I SAM-dependent methyltransferase [Candidatus Gastranaerophilales bacterium]|nr:class I SAM-dependent methyltransferase [Candidatus Gastranaerophilales bacterium]